VGILNDFIAAEPEANAFEIDCRMFVSRLQRAKVRPALAGMDGNIHAAILDVLAEPAEQFGKPSGCSPPVEP
jgi:hypothetical protein